MPRSSKRQLLGVAVALSFLTAPGEANTCVKTSGPWTSTTRLTPYAGTPTVPCLIGHPVVMIDSSATTGLYTAGPVRVLRCGITSEPFSYTGGHGSIHKFQTLSNWENVLGDCSQLVYETN